MRNPDVNTPATTHAYTQAASGASRRAESWRNAAELGIGLLAVAGVFIIATVGGCVALAVAFFMAFDDCYPKEYGATLDAPSGAVRASEWSQACGGALGDNYTHVTLLEFASGDRQQVFRAPVNVIDMRWEGDDLFIVHIRDGCPNDLRKHISGRRAWKDIAIRIEIKRVTSGVYFAGC